MDFDPNFEKVLKKELCKEIEYANKLKAFESVPGFKRLVEGLSIETSIPASAIVPSMSQNKNEIIIVLSQNKNDF